MKGEEGEAWGWKVAVWRDGEDSREGKVGEGHRMDSAMGGEGREVFSNPVKAGKEAGREGSGDGSGLRAG